MCFQQPRTDGGQSTSADLKLDLKELESKFSSKTKLLVLNNPHNPTGKLFSREELAGIAHLAAKYDVLVLADEVYEWMVYPGHEMIRFGSFSFLSAIQEIFFIPEFSNACIASICLLLELHVGLQKINQNIFNYCLPFSKFAGNVRANDNDWERREDIQRDRVEVGLGGGAREAARPAQVCSSELCLHLLHPHSGQFILSGSLDPAFPGPSMT